MSTVTILQRVGLIANEITPPRDLSGLLNVVTSILAVAFSCFFVWVAFFGPPVSEVFRGTFVAGIAVLTILSYRGRQKPLSLNAVWLDELFAYLATAATFALFAVGLYWMFVDPVPQWRHFASDTVWIIGVAGGLIGTAVYAWEGTRAEISQRLQLSDIAFIIAGVLPVVWWFGAAEELAMRIGSPVPSIVVIMAGLLAAVSFEVARRIVGPVIPLLGFLFFIYSFEPIAQSAPGILQHGGFRTARVMEFMLLNSDGMLGLVVNVFASVVVIFVIMGAFLEKSGLGQLFTDAAYRITGKGTGGPGLAAVASSGSFGMITGSGVANVVTTGTFTIPLMKRVGYRPTFAGAVEAAASTGGAYMPPVMGAGAFLLAEFTETPYVRIITIALIPALLYYLSVGLMVYLRARRDGLHGVPLSELPAWSAILPRLHLLLPIGVMIYYLVIGDSAFLAAGKTIVLIVMLKVLDLAVAVRTPWSGHTWKLYLVLSAALGVVAVAWGVEIGAPFTWFADEFFGIRWGDGIYWMIGGFAILKVLEIVIAGLLPTSSRADEDGNTETVTGGAMFARLVGIVVELVRTIWVSLEAGARNTLLIGCIAAVLGILLSNAFQSDLPNRFSLLLVDWSFGLLPITIFWTIVAGYIIGMGAPIVASYVLLLTFAVPALTALGVPAMSAHMTSYWVAVVSAVTPPVALAAYAASAISRADPVATGFEAVKLASMILIMPFMFIYTPLLLDGTTVDITVTTVASVIGVVAWAFFLEGQGIRATAAIERSVLLVAAICLLLPAGSFVAWLAGFDGDLRYQAYLVGTLLFIIVVILQLLRRPPETAVSPAGE